MSVSDTLELADVIRNAIASAAIDVHTSIPARVESYDPVKQVANVRPMIKRVLRTEAGERRAEELPVIPCVPVTFPSANGFMITFPVKKGTTGLLTFSETSIDRWRATGQSVDPGDTRRHSLTGATFAPGLRVASDPLANASADNMVMGSDAGDGKVELSASLVSIGGALAAVQGIGLGTALDTWAAAITAHLVLIQAWALLHFHDLPPGTPTTPPIIPPIGPPPPPVPPVPPPLASKHKVQP